MKGATNYSNFARFFIPFSVIFLTVEPIQTVVESRKLISRDRNTSDQSAAAIFNILSYGAKGDGVSDDSDAVLDGWDAACKVSNATLLIPSEYKFLVNLVELKGPCKSNLTFQVDGTILAPSKGSSSWPETCWGWITFRSLNNLTVQGTGIFDGQGFDWWKSKKIHGKPTAVKFDSSENVTVRNITIQNSAKFHLDFYDVVGVTVNNITIYSPETSPNTDGIHIEETKDVIIQDAHVDAGDDCISIQTGTRNVNISDIYCGSTHGISIGGLGKDGTFASVKDITVENVVMNRSQNGARIKTWLGGRGKVRKVRFSNIQMLDVKYPIVINQKYCDGEKKSSCNHKHGDNAVFVTDVEFDHINGTYTRRPIDIECSDSKPCTELRLTSVQLQPSPTFKNEKDPPVCSNSFGITRRPLLPPSLSSCLIRN